MSYPVISDISPNSNAFFIGIDRVEVDSDIYFKITDLIYGSARNTFSLTINGTEIIDKGLLSLLWGLNAVPTLLDQLGNDISLDKCNWGSFDGSTESSKIKDDFSDDNPDWNDIVNINDNSRRWYKWIRGDSTFITLDTVNNVVNFDINSAVNNTGYLILAGSGVGVESGYGGKDVALEGDFSIEVLFDIVTWDSPQVDAGAFALKLCKTNLEFAEQLHVERFNEPTGAGDGFGCVIGQPVDQPGNWDWLNIPTENKNIISNSLLVDLGFKVTRIDADVLVEYTYDNGASWLLLDEYIDWYSGSLYIRLGAMVWSGCNRLEVNLKSFILESGVTNKPRDITYNLTHTNDFKEGAIQVLEASIENYNGELLSNQAWWFYTQPVTPFIQNQDPPDGLLGVPVNSSVYFELGAQDSGINMSLLSVLLTKYTNTDILGVDSYVIYEGAVQTGYTVNFTYVELNRTLQDIFQGSLIDFRARWGSITGNTNGWSQDNTLFYDSTGFAGTSVLSTTGKGQLTGDFDVILDVNLTKILPIPGVANENSVCMTVNDGTNYIRVGRVRTTGNDSYRIDKNSVDNVTSIDTTQLTNLNFRLKRVGSVVYASYYTDTPYKHWESIGSGITLSTLPVDLELRVITASDIPSNNITAEFPLLEQIKGEGSFPGQVNIEVTPDDLFIGYTLPNPRITAYSWSGGLLETSYSFEIKGILPHIEFSYPCYLPNKRVRIIHGIDEGAPNRKITKSVRRNETASGLVLARNIGYASTKLGLNLILLSIEEVEAIRSFFRYVVKGKSLPFRYINYITGDEANVQFLNDNIDFKLNGGEPYSLDLLLKESSDIVNLEMYVDLELLWNIS